MRPYLTNGPLHPLTFELTAKVPTPKEQLLHHWRAQLPGIQNHLPSGSLSSVPLVCSALLWQRLQEKTQELCAWLAPTLAQKQWEDTFHWTSTSSADVLSLDLAVVADNTDPSGWNLQWVEFQAFTSIVATIYTLANASREVWPVLDSLSNTDYDIFAPDWVAQYKQWVAPSPLSILLEEDPLNRPTSFDLETNAQLLSIPLVSPHDLQLSDKGLVARHSNHVALQPVSHIYNRLILGDTPQPEQLVSLLNFAPISWHCHPSWYYRINKRLLADLPLPPHLKCISADRWRELHRPAEDLVLKEKESYGGTAVKLQVTERELDTLDSPEKWLVQPRFTPLPLFIATDNQPVFGEIRCVVQLREDGSFKSFARFARLYRGKMASVKSAIGAPGEGLGILYGPPV